MPVQQVPGIFDFLGQGLGDVSSVLQKVQARKDALDAQSQEQTRRDAQFLATMVQSGAIDSDTANQSDTAKSLNLHFQPSAAELRRKIMASPAGPNSTATSVPLSPSGGQSVQIPALKTPWSEDQRFVAGLPSSGAQATEMTNAKLAAIKARYLQDPKSVSDTEAAAAGLPTSQDVALKKRQELDPIVSKDAANYVSQTINSTITAAKINPETPEGVRALNRQAASISASAYNQYVTDAKAAGNGLATDPANKGYIKAFFDAEVSKSVKAYQDEILKNKALNPPTKVTSSAEWFQHMSARAEELVKENDAIRKGSDWMMISTAKTLTPDMQATKDAYQRNTKQIDIYHKAATALGSGADAKQVLPALQKELEALDPKQGAATPPASTPPAKPAGKGATPDQIQQAVAAIKSGKATIAELQGLVQKGTITAQDFQTIVSQLPKP